MIFASDLDRTLIYSKRSMGTVDSDSALRLIETKNGQEISYMTEKAISLLEEINALHTFIPVTTRTEAEYNRIILFKRLQQRFAITNNGAKILDMGLPDSDWSKIIASRLASCFDKVEVQYYFSKISHASWVERMIEVDEFLVFQIIPEAVPVDELANFVLFLKKNDWTVSQQGRKLYMVPDCINKWDGLAYIEQQLGKKVICAAGDSELDMAMLKRVSHGFIPVHSAIQTVLANINYTEVSGIAAAEEILQKVSAIMNQTLPVTTK